MPRWCARRTIAVMSSGLITAPDGLPGEFRMMSLVRGVMARSIISGGEREIARLVGLDQHRLAARVAHDVLERHPVGHRQDDLVAMIDQHLDGVEQRVLAAGGGDGLVALVVGAEIHVVAVDDRRRAARPMPGTDVYLVKFCWMASDGGVLDVLRRGEMRLARAKIHHVDARSAQLLRLAHHRHGGRDLDALDAVGQRLPGFCGSAHNDSPVFLTSPGRPPFTLWRSFCSTRGGTSPRTEPPSWNTSLMSRELR